MTLLKTILKKIFSHLLIFLFTFSLISKTTNAQSVKNETDKEKFFRLSHQIGMAVGKKDFAKATKLQKERCDISPTNPYEQYCLARAYALNKETDKAFNYLEKTLLMEGKFLLNLKADKEFYNSFNKKKIGDFLQKAKKKLVSVGKSETAYIIKDKKLIPEGVAYDEVTRKLYISSIYKRKIVCIDKNGKVTDFKTSVEDGLLGVVGMEVDPVRRHLWVCSGYYSNNKIYEIENTSDRETRIYKYNIDNGKLLGKFAFANGERGFFNDVTISKTGDAYFTDTHRTNVYKIPFGSSEIKLFFSDKNMFFTNGITISDNGKNLFVASHTGIRVVDTKTGKGKLIKHSDEITLTGIDGLAFYKNTLIAHQGFALGGIMQYKLNETHDKVISRKKLDMFNPLFNIPTTGEIVGDKYFYIANAQVRSFDKNGELLPEDKLEEVYILKLSL
ncbi:MAG: SMP-30/gluconolactonase/LRE family protein [Rhodothermaceae bacterium]